MILAGRHAAYRLASRPDLARGTLFLDRDGIINEDRSYVHRVEDFAFREGIFELCEAASARQLRIAVVTNQAGIGRGLFSEGQFLELTGWMLDQFSSRGIQIDDVEYCPYHPHHGIGQYKQECRRRKPGPGMIQDAARDLNSDLHRSIMIGDKATDVLAGQAAGVRHLVLVSDDPGESLLVPSATHVVADLRQAQRVMSSLALSA